MENITHQAFSDHHLLLDVTPDKEVWVQQRKEFIPKPSDLSSDPQVDFFLGDESCFDGDPRSRQRWVRRGLRPTQGYYGGHVRAIVVGAVDPTNPDLNPMEHKAGVIWAWAAAIYLLRG